MKLNDVHHVAVLSPGTMLKPSSVVKRLELIEQV